MPRKLLLISGLAILFFTGLYFLTYFSFEPSLIMNASQGGVWLFPLIAVSALLDSINPCAFSVLLITIAFLFSLGKPRREVLLLGGSYIAGLYLAYFLIGLGILKALHVFGVPHFMGRLGAAAVIIFGILNLLGYFFPNVNWLPGIPASVHTKIAALMQKVSLPGVFLVGVLVALCEFPCTGGPYLMILGLLHDSATYLSGFGYLVFYNLLFVSPLILILLVASHTELLEKVDAWRKMETKKMKLGVGVAMLALGIIILFFI